MKIFFASVLIFATLFSLAKEGEFSLDKRLDEEIAKNEKKNFEGKIPESEKLFYSESSKSAFIIFAKNLELRNFGFGLVSSAERAVEEMFGEVAEFKIPIELHFLSAEDAKFEGDFLETSRFKNDIVLSVKCSKNLSVDKFYERIANIYLRTYTAKLGGKKAHPYWLELALRAMIARQVAELVPIELARYLKKVSPDKILDVFNYLPKSNADELKMEASAYFALLGLRSVCGGNSKVWFDTLKYFILNGVPSETYLQSRFGNNYKDKFLVLPYGEIYARLSGVKDLATSDTDVANLFTIQKMRKGGAVEIIAGADIFARKDEIKKEISKRVTEIKVELPWVNPIYYNTLIAIGRMYDDLTYGENEDIFNENLLDALNEFNNARELAKKASKLLE